MSAVYEPPRGPAAKLTRRMRYALGRQPVTCAPERGVLTICFDDFPKSAAVDGAEVLQDLGACASYFASGGFAGGADHIGQMYDGGDLVRLSRKGHEIGCHTYSHLDCAKAPVGEVLADLDRNERALRAMGLESPLTSFAFPYGEASIAAKKAISGRFEAMRGVRAGLNRGRCDGGLLKALCIDGGDGAINKATDLLASAARDPAWVILFAHGVEHIAGRWSVTPGQLARCARAAYALGLDVQTFGDAAKTCLTVQATRRGAANWFTTRPAGNPPRASTSSARA